MGIPKLQMLNNFVQIGARIFLKNARNVVILNPRWQTGDDHANITNEELDWKRELEKRELVSISGNAGTLLQKRTHLLYKREHLGPWNYMVPTLLVIVTIGFGFSANMNPKFEMRLEPRSDR